MATSSPTDVRRKPRERAKSAGRNSAKADLERLAVQALLVERGYPSEWTKNRIRPANRYFSGSSARPAEGIVVLNRLGHPFVYIRAEDANPDPGLTSELEEVFGVSDQLRIVVSFSGCEYAVLRRTLTGVSPGRLPSWRLGAQEGQVLPAADLLPLTERVESVFFELHSTMRDVDGMHADQALDEVCKLILAKAYDEDANSDNCQFRSDSASCDEEVVSIIHALYREASEALLSASAPHSASPGIELTDAALLGCVRLLEPYSITRSPTDIRGRAFQRVIDPALRAGMGQYFTPSQIVALVVAVIGPRTGERILDPFAGSAGFLAASLDALGAQLTSPALGSTSRASLFGIEKSDRMVRVAATDLRLHGDGQTNMVAADSLSHFAELRWCERGSFDVVVTNPPFGSLLGKEAIAELDGFELTMGRSSVPLEVLGLERCVQFLRPGGRLGIVLPDGLLVNRKSAHVRDWLLGQVQVRAIVSLPVETFAPFGANVKTSILFARRLMPGESAYEHGEVAMVRVENVGYDASGRHRPGSDLGSTKEWLRKFLAKEGW